MDIATLNVVIAKLEQEVENCQEMIQWTVKRLGDDEVHNRDLDMWCFSKVQAQDSLNIVKEMLDEELALRAQEAA